MKHHSCTRREFLRWGLTATAIAPVGAFLGQGLTFAADSSPAPASALARKHAGAKVALARCTTYEVEKVRAALSECFDTIGGIGSLVKNKTVTVKLNLTGTNFTPFMERPVGESYMTHDSTVLALASLLFGAGAKRIRLVESNQSRAKLESTLELADWNVKTLTALGKVEYENTRNLGSGKSYSHLRVPFGGYMFSSFELNHAYEETDVMVSLCKLKTHITAGITLSMKNLFGLTPNALYGDKAGSEDATAGRGPLHSPRGFDHIKLPGLKPDFTSTNPMYRVPRIIVDLCAARPIDLAIIDGITSMSGGEGPWCRNAGPLKLTTPGVLIAGFNPVATDAVGTAVMGYDPRATKGTKPFEHCDNHLLLAEQVGLGTADLGQIDVRGLALEKARYPYG